MTGDTPVITPHADRVVEENDRLVNFVELAVVRWHISGLLFSALVAAILLGVLASVGSWWLWPVVAFLGAPALAVVLKSSENRPVVDAAGWHLRPLR